MFYVTNSFDHPGSETEDSEGIIVTAVFNDKTAYDYVSEKIAKKIKVIQRDLSDAVFLFYVTEMVNGRWTAIILGPNFQSFITLEDAGSNIGEALTNCLGALSHCISDHKFDAQGNVILKPHVVF